MHADTENADAAVGHARRLNGPDVWLESERRRLVRLCAGFTGDRDSAEDLAQETLLEAWRNLHKLHDPAGADRWLTAIARNVCLRWARQRGRDVAALAPADPEPALADSVDLEADLERAELVELLDRALGLLPAETREVLVHRYVDEAPHAEIGARLGLSEDAVSMRLTRGKASLRRLLASELHAEAAAYGLVDTSDGGWRETRIWCPVCGRRKLLARRNGSPGAVSFRCPGCDPRPEALASEFRLDNPVFERLLRDVVRPSAVLARTSQWIEQYFSAGAETGHAECTRCGASVRVERYERDDVRSDHSRRGLVAACDACGEVIFSSLSGLALSIPGARAFRRSNPRLRTMPMQEVETAGVPAVVVRYENVLGSTGVAVVFARDTLRVLDVHID